jgi:hypothetical protein
MTTLRGKGVLKSNANTGTMYTIDKSVLIRHLHNRHNLDLRGIVT